MSSVLERDALERSPLADLHVIANELGVDGFRRLRKPELIDSIIARQAGTEGDDSAPDAPDDGGAPDAPDDSGAPDARAERAPDDGPAAETEEGATDEDAPRAEEKADDDAAARPRRGRRGGRGRGRREEGRDADAQEEPEAPPARDRSVEGVVELLGNGSAFIRLDPPETSDEDVYVSAAQVKRCELVSGDRIGGPVRGPRRSERFPSLVRVDTINGRPAEEVAEGTKFDELPVAWPSERLALDSEDVTLKAVEWLTPFGKGSRVLICGAPRAGKTELARAIAEALSGRDGLELLVVLAGVRPEEAGDWAELSPVAVVSFAGSPDAQAQAVEQAIEQGRRVAARGGDAVIVVDTLEWLAAVRGSPRPVRGAQHRRRRVPHGDRDRPGAVRRRDDGDHAGRAADRAAPVPRAGAGGQRHAAVGRAGRRGRCRGDRQGPRGGRREPGLSRYRGVYATRRQFGSGESSIGSSSRSGWM